MTGKRMMLKKTRGSAPPPSLRPQSTRERKSEHHVNCDPAAVTSRPSYDGALAGLRCGRTLKRRTYSFDCLVLAKKKSCRQFPPQVSSHYGGRKRLGMPVMWLNYMQPLQPIPFNLGVFPQLVCNLRQPTAHCRTKKPVFHARHFPKHLSGESEVP